MATGRITNPYEQGIPVIEERRRFFWFWAISLFVITFVNYPHLMLPRDYKNFTFLFVGLMSLVLFKKGERMELWLYPLILLIAFNHHHLWAKTPTFKGIFALVGVALVYQFKQFADVTKFEKLFGWFCIIQCLWCFSQWLGISPYTLVSGRELFFVANGDQVAENLPVVGSLGNHMVSGTFIILTMPFLFSLAAPLFLIPIGTAFILPSGLVPVGILFFVGLLATYKWYNKPLFWVISISGAVGSYFILEPYGVFVDGERVKIWKEVFTYMEINWLFGEGLGYFKDYFHLLYGHKFGEKHGHPHNEFLYIALSSGVLGIAAVGTMYYRAAVALRRIPLYCSSFLVSIVPMLFGFPLHTASTAVIMIVSLAHILRERDNFMSLKKGV